MLLDDGESVQAHVIVVATDQRATAKLIGNREEPPESRATTTLYFAANQPPLEGPFLILNGMGRGVVNHFAAMSEVAPSYAPKGKALISATVIGIPRSSDATLSAIVREDLREWFGDAVLDWRLLVIYRVADALPGETSFRRDVPARRVSDRLWICGDHLGNASIDGALQSGRVTAEAIIQTGSWGRASGF